MNNYKLGKQPYRHDDRTLQLKDYLTDTLPTPPVSVDYASRVASWPMYLNDKESDCTAACAGHLVELWEAMGISDALPTDADVQALYNTVNGGKDEGAVILDLLLSWRKNGLSGEHPFAFAQIDHTNVDNIKLAIALFAGIDIGLELPIAAQNEDVWSCVPSNDPNTTPSSWGGHSICVLSFDADTLTCITWGAPKKLTWDFFQNYCSEAWALIPSEWQNISPTGFNYELLKQDLAALGTIESPTDPIVPIPPIKPPLAGLCGVIKKLLHLS